MRVLMVITSYHPIVGGAEKQVAQLARIMSAQGHEVSVLTRRHPGLAAEEEVGGITVRRIAAPGPKPAAAASFVLGATRAIRAIRPDVIHCHSLFTPSLAGSLGKRLAGVPLLAKPMCGGEATSIARKPLGRWRLSHLGRTVDRFIAVSREIERELTGLGIPADKIRFIPNGVDLARFRPAGDTEARRSLRAALGLPDGCLFVFAGRMAAQKRLPFLLEAWREVASAMPKATLLIAGANREASARAVVDGGDGETVAAELLDQPGVRFLGHVEDMPSHLRAADVFVLPSAREGLSNALLEACASGLAVIAANVGGTEDFIESGRNGLLFPVADRDMLGKMMLRLASDAELREELGRAARAAVEARYDITDTAERLIGQYRELGGERG